MDDLQRLVLEAMQLHHVQRVGPYMLVSKAWAATIREISRSSLLHTYWAERNRTVEHVYVELCVEESEDGLTDEVEMCLDVVRGMNVVEGRLCGMQVKISCGISISISREISRGTIWVSDVVTSVEEMSPRLQQLLILACPLGLEVYVEVESEDTAVKLARFGTYKRDGWQGLLQLLHPLQ